MLLKHMKHVVEIGPCVQRIKCSLGAAGREEHQGCEGCGSRLIWKSARLRDRGFGVHCGVCSVVEEGRFNMECERATEGRM